MFLLPPYSADKFVDRDAEIDLVNNVIERLCQPDKRKDDNKALLFRGERGLGKTWLAIHLHRTVLPGRHAESLYLAFCPPPHEYQVDRQVREWIISEPDQPECACLELMRWTCAQLKINLPNQPDLVEVRRALIDGVKAKFNRPAALVFILDAVYEADWEFLKVVEENILAPLAEIPNVLFIMTGRGKPYPWISPAIRMGIQEMPLTELSQSELAELKKANAPGSEIAIIQLADLGGGSPLVGYLLLHATNPFQALDAIIDYMLGVAPPGVNHVHLREAFEALCVLEEFREGEMNVMIKEYYRILANNPAQELGISPVPVRQLRDELLGTNLFFWGVDGYKIDASLRVVLRNYLKTNQFDLWRGLNSAAYHLYLGYAEQYPQYKIDYESLAKPYQAILDMPVFRPDAETNRQAGSNEQEA